jgi:hypothetical protein
MKQRGDVPIHNAFSTLLELCSIHLLLHPLSEIMTTLFYNTWKEFLDAKAKQEHDAALTTWVETTLQRGKTANIAMELDNLNLQSPQLGELIDTHINNKFKRVKNKLKTILVNTHKKLSNWSKQQCPCPKQVEAFFSTVYSSIKQQQN